MSDLPTPNDRVESLLMAILTGDGSDLPTPRTRTEKLLMAIYENGGTGGGGEGVTPAQVKTILLANTDTALNGASSNPIANKALVDALADYVKSADLSIPTKVSELTNDKKYQTDTDLVTALTPYAKSDDVTAEIIAEIAKVVAGAPESFDTLKEMADWIAHHEDDATAMNSAIQKNKTDIETLQTDKADKSEIPTTVAELTDSADYAKTANIPKTLPANGGNAATVNNHTVKSDVPENAVFTDTIYDDTEVKGSIEELSSNLDTLEYGENAGGKNILDINKVLEWINKYTNGTYSNDTLTISPINTYLFTYPFQFSDVDIDVTLSVESFNFVDGSNARISLLNLNNASVGDINTSMTTISAKASKIRIDFSTLPTSITLSKLMLQLGTQATAYEPYIPSVKMLAEEVGKQNESLSVIGKCKNLLNPILETTTQNGVTWTNNGDGTYTLNGTATTNTWFTLGKAKLYSGKTYRLCGLNRVGNSTLYVQLRNDNIIMQTTNNGIDVSITETSENYLVVAFIPEGVTYNNIIYKPMLTKDLTATYDDFVPYTGDGETLTHDVAGIRNDLSSIINGLKIYNDDKYVFNDTTEIQNAINEYIVDKYDGCFIINGTRGALFGYYNTTNGVGYGMILSYYTRVNFTILGGTVNIL